MKPFKPTLKKLFRKDNIPPASLLSFLKEAIQKFKPSNQFICWVMENHKDKDAFQDYVEKYNKSIYPNENNLALVAPEDVSGYNWKIEWLKQAIQSIEERQSKETAKKAKNNPPRDKKLSDTKVYKQVKKALKDDPESFKLAYTDMKNVWDNQPVDKQNMIDGAKLDEAFLWSHTKQRYNFWDSIFAKISE